MDVATNRNSISLSYLNMCELKRKHVASESRRLAAPRDIAYNARAAVPAIITTGLVRISLSLGAVPSYLALALPPQVLTSHCHCHHDHGFRQLFNAYSSIFNCCWQTQICVEILTYIHQRWLISSQLRCYCSTLWTLSLVGLQILNLRNTSHRTTTRIWQCYSLDRDE